MPAPKTVQIFHKAQLSLKPEASPGYHKVKPLDWECFGREPLFVTSLNLDSADDGISEGELPPLPAPHWGSWGLLFSPPYAWTNRGPPSRVAPQLFPVLIPLCPSLPAPHPCSEALLGSRRDVAPWAGKECLHSWKSPVSYFGIPLPAGSNVSSLPAFPNVGVACMPTSPFSLPPHVAIANFCACA